MAKYLHNLSAYCIIKIFTILRNTHIVPRNPEKNVFYDYHYIDWDQFNYLYILDWLEKDV